MKRKENEKILKDKDLLESDVRQKQEETAELENTYKELLLLSQQLKVIKRNEAPAAGQEDGVQLSPNANGRNTSEAAISVVSNEMEMMMDVPDDFDENEFLAENIAGQEDDHDERLGSATLESSRQGSVVSDNIVSSTPKGNKGGHSQLRSKSANVPPSKAGTCGDGGDGACCTIF